MNYKPYSEATERTVMKEMFAKTKKFCRDHQEGILIAAGCSLGAFVASYASTKATLSDLRLKEVGYDEDNRMISITYKNGEIDRYFPTNTSK
jgi:hypothetical protein